MANLVFVSGGFSSGTTLAFTLLRSTGEYQCLYEPLHERLREYLIWPLRAYEGHEFVGDYFTELRRLRATADLLDPSWGASGLYLGPGDQNDALYRYLTYIIGGAFAERGRVVIKENRLSFRLGWLRAHFPAAKIIHVWRDCDDQWSSIVRRAQAGTGLDDVGQSGVDVGAFNVGRWCDDLSPTFPELSRERSTTGRERFGKLWELTRHEHEQYADISVELSELQREVAATWRRIGDCLDFSFDIAALERLVVADRGDPPQTGARRPRGGHTIDDLGRRYARMRVRLDDRRRRRGR